MRRGKINSRQSDRNFRNGLGVHPKNRIDRPMRGGIRL
jgi:hypothetical protein